MRSVNRSFEKKKKTKQVNKLNHTIKIWNYATPTITVPIYLWDNFTCSCSVLSYTNDKKEAAKIFFKCNLHLLLWTLFILFIYFTNCRDFYTCKTDMILYIQFFPMFLCGNAQTNPTNHLFKRGTKWLPNHTRCPSACSCNQRPSCIVHYCAFSCLIPFSTNVI